MTPTERSVACLKGIAAGDAVGKQTEGLTPEEISAWYPGGVKGFHGQPGSVLPRYTGKRYEWKVGETTADTEQTLATAYALLKNPDASHIEFGEELLKCRKSNRLTLSLGRFQQHQNPAHLSEDGDGCGAAKCACRHRVFIQELVCTRCSRFSGEYPYSRQPARNLRRQFRRCRRVRCRKCTTTG